MGDFYRNRILRPGIQRAIADADEEERLLRRKLTPQQHAQRVEVARECLREAVAALLAAESALDHLSCDVNDLVVIELDRRQIQDVASRLGVFRPRAPRRSVLHG